MNKYEVELFTEENMGIYLQVLEFLRDMYMRDFIRTSDFSHYASAGKMANKIQMLKETYLGKPV